jgi:hypothetical protein
MQQETYNRSALPTSPIVTQHTRAETITDPAFHSSRDGRTVAVNIPTINPRFNRRSRDLRLENGRRCGSHKPY